MTADLIVNMKNIDFINRDIKYKKLTNNDILVNIEHYDYFYNHLLTNYIEKNKILKKQATCTPSWGIDRLNQYDLPLDNNYNYLQTDASNIDVYVIDTGVDINHKEFIDNKPTLLDSFGSDNPYDCDGHGTHVTGIIIGKYSGIAKNANLYSIKIDHNCNGNAYASDMISAIDLATNKMINSKRKSIINLSFSVSKSIVDKLNIFMDNGGIVITSSGNDGNDITNELDYKSFNINKGFLVGSTNKYDELSDFSNYGSNVYIYAPGSNILSANYNNDNKCISYSGTSMAAPFVSGIVALYWNNKTNVLNSHIITNLIYFSNKDKIKTNLSIHNNLIYLTPNFKQIPENNFGLITILFIFIMSLFACIVIICRRDRNNLNYHLPHLRRRNINLPNINDIDDIDDIDDDYNPEGKEHSLEERRNNVIQNIPVEGVIDVDLKYNNSESSLKLYYDENNFVDESAPKPFFIDIPPENDDEGI